MRKIGVLKHNCFFLKQTLSLVKKEVESKSARKLAFFQMKKVLLNIEKKNFPQNILCYVKQAYISTVKGGKLAIYNHSFILGRLVVAASQHHKIDEYVCKKKRGQDNCLPL